MTINFSSDVGNISRTDIDKTGKISEDYFGTERDPEQMAITKENQDWIYENNSYLVNVIKDGKKIIGYSFFLPCSKDTMNKFLSKKINEFEMFNIIKNKDFNSKWESIYFCAAVVDDKYQKKGLATNASIKQIAKISTKIKGKPSGFYWGYSKEGEKLAEKVSKLSGIKFVSRK